MIDSRRKAITISGKMAFSVVMNFIYGLSTFPTDFLKIDARKVSDHGESHSKLEGT